MARKIFDSDRILQFCAGCVCPASPGICVTSLGSDEVPVYSKRILSARSCTRASKLILSR
jgi:hypothetical protein